MNNIIIDETVKIGKNVTIEPNNIILNNTIIEDNCHIKYGNYISNCHIKNNSIIEYSHIVDSIIESNCVIGPYSRIRPNSHIGDNCKIGNFVEIKNSKLSNGVKASHLSYIGDAEIGSNCNIGCGVIFANYDGKNKHKTIVKNNCFIGCNCNIIAPVTIAENTYICAGTTLTKDTKPNDFIIGRVKECVKPNRNNKFNNFS